MPVITNANVASYGFAANETEKNEKDATAPKDEMPTDDDLEIMKQELLMQAYLCSEILTISEMELREMDPNFEYAYDLYRTFYECLSELQTLMYRIEYASTMEELESCRQELDLLVSKIEQLQKDIEALSIIVAVTKEGIEMTFKILDMKNKIVQVGDYKTSAVSQDTKGIITIPAEVNGYKVVEISNNAFNGCSGLTSVAIPDSVTYIGESAFYNCSGLTSVTIPDGVKSIGGSAFYNCSSLTSVTIPKSVTYISTYAFSNCKGLNKVIVPDIAAWCGISFVNEVANPLYYAKHLYSDDNTEITELIIPEGVNSIKDYAFYNCKSLITVNIPAGATSIGISAFRGCSSLTSVTIPNSVTSIGSSAFWGCSSLTSVTIPNSVTSIGSSAFYGCSSLTSVTIPNSVTSMNKYVFYNCSSLTSVTIPNSITSIAQGTFYGCERMTSVTIPNSVTSIGPSAFYYCRTLSSVTIPNSVTKIGYSAFQNCWSLSSVVIPESVTSIDSEAFYNCDLGKVYCLAENAPVTDNSAFSSEYGYVYDWAKLYVPAGSIDSYKATSPWSKFGTIIGLTEDDIDGILEVESSKLKVESTAYDLSGRQIVNGHLSNGKLPKGINIIRYPDGTTRKVLVK